MIDFRILGGYVGNDMLGKSLLLDFGDIRASAPRSAAGLMETSLAGRFVEFNASFTHADSLGGAVTSLIKEVRAHKLVPDVLVDLAGHDDVYDFLAEFGNGYWVYDSSGGDAEVIDASKQASLTSVSGGNLRLSFPPASNLVHAKVPDPFSGSKPITRVVRSDGKVLPAQNYWLSKTRNADLRLVLLPAYLRQQCHWRLHPRVRSGHQRQHCRQRLPRQQRQRHPGCRQALRQPRHRAQGGGRQWPGHPPPGLHRPVWRLQLHGSGTRPLPTRSRRRRRLDRRHLDGWQRRRCSPARPDQGHRAHGRHRGHRLPVAKRKPDPSQNTDQADVSIAIQAAKSQLRSGEATSVTVTVRNAGEASAQGVTAQVAVPAGLTLQGNGAGLGSYAGGAWTIGGLTKGQSVTLTLDVKADQVSGTQDKTLSWPVSISASTHRSADRQQQRLAQPHRPGRRRKPTPSSCRSPAAAEARVLMLVSCPQAAAAEQARYETQATQAAQDMLSANVQVLQTATTLSGWNAAQRSGAYSVLWLHGGADKLDEQALAEIRAAVRRGATLVVDGLPGVSGAEPKLNQLADVMSARISTPAIGSGQSVKFPNEPTAQPAGGALYGLQLQSPPAQRLAKAARARAPP